tara:strand:- start:750 stop:863 length:114 start_codon:yes stop_codon:yes gene_type:complete
MNLISGALIVKLKEMDTAKLYNDGDKVFEVAIENCFK